MEPASQEDRIATLLQGASSLGNAAEQRDFLEHACQGEPALLAELLETVTLPDRQSTPGPPPQLFDAGSVVAGRFQIRRRLGEGGMAVVYEAWDQKLAERRALKFPKAGHSRSIPPEARSALRVTHRNICRIHEIHTAATDAGAADFISMEFVDGDTLYSRWKREPVPQAEALDIATQLCGGVDAAHSAGILHRDLKSSNVMLARRTDGAPRVVIMDFGLALQASAGGPSSMSGTPAYMAPERWSGSPASVASDIYALGVVFYEMLAGRHPFPHGTSWKRRLEELPDPPSRSERKPDARWDGLVLRCLNPDPAKRFPSAGDVLDSIEQTFHPVSTRRRWIAVAALLIATVPVIALRHRIWPPPLARLAVLPFTGSAANPDVDKAVKGGLYDLAGRIESLGASSQRLAVIPIDEALRYEVNSTALAASRLRATHALSGSIGASGSGLWVHATVTDLRDGQVLRDFSGDFRTQDLTGMSTALAGVVTSAFHLDKAPPARVLPAAYPQYAAGLASLRARPPNFEDALISLQAALQIDGASPLIYSSLAEAYLWKLKATNDTKWLHEASSAAHRAESLNPDSPPVLLVLGDVEAAEGAQEKAIEIYRRAAELEPTNPEGWRRAGVTFTALGHDKEAVRALRKAIELSPGSYAAHLNLGNNFFRRGRYSEAVTEYRLVTELAPELPDGHAYLGAALLAIEKEPEAEQALKKSIQLRETRAALNNLGVLLRYQGRDREAAETLERALRAGADDSNIRLNLANALRRIGRTGDARENYQRANELARRALLQNPRDFVSRARLAYSLVQLGDPQLAADEALQAARLAPADYSVLYWSVMTLEALGQREDALQLLGNATYQYLNDLRRQPDLAKFGADPHFIKRLQSAKIATLERKNDAR